MISLVCEEIVGPGPQSQRRTRGPDDRFRDVKVYTLKCYGSEREHAYGVMSNH